jgi:hypothetical protein
MERPHTEMNDTSGDSSPVIAGASNAWWEMVGYGIAQARQHHSLHVSFGCSHQGGQPVLMQSQAKT